MGRGSDRREMMVVTISWAAVALCFLTRRWHGKAFQDPKDCWHEGPYESRRTRCPGRSCRGRSGARRCPPGARPERPPEEPSLRRLAISVWNCRRSVSVRFLRIAASSCIGTSLPLRWGARGGHHLGRGAGPCCHHRARKIAEVPAYSPARRELPVWVSGLRTTGCGTSRASASRRTRSGPLWAPSRRTPPGRGRATCGRSRRWTPTPS